jgi:hypothetical protein
MQNAQTLQHLAPRVLLPVRPGPARLPHVGFARTAHNHPPDTAARLPPAREPSKNVQPVRLAGLFWEKSTVGWLLVAGLFW